MPKQSEPVLIVERRNVGFGGSHRETRVRELAEGEDAKDFELAPVGAAVTDWRSENAH